MSPSQTQEDVLIAILRGLEAHTKTTIRSGPFSYCSALIEVGLNAALRASLLDHPLGLRQLWANYYGDIRANNSSFLRSNTLDAMTQIVFMIKSDWC